MGGEASPAEPASWAKYGERDVTRREHARELRTYLQLAPFGLSDFRAPVRELTELAQQTDKGLLLAGQALGEPTAETTHPAGAERD